METERIATIKDRLNEALCIRRMKQLELSNVTGISRVSISTYATGKCSPKSDTVTILSAALHVSEMWLLGYDVPMEDLNPDVESKTHIKKISTIPERLKEALSQRYMTQARLCRATGIPEDCMSHYANGKAIPSADKIQIISSALRVSEMWLRGYDVPMTRK